MKIKVLQHHIDEGKKGNNRSCAVALAMKEQMQLADNEHLGVSYQKAFIQSSSDLGVTTARRTLFADLPPEAHSFIIRFDANKSVEPFEMDIEFRVLPI